ncbi:hypothetical protein LBMAG42_23920 [Deltaproteobacteria bacterium]|nr:hypothetical protein LBMAG42_23920 [Deltaproteobacteria bacterium]
MKPDAAIAAVPGLLTTRTWYEPAVALAALKMPPDARVLAACGAGDVAFALASAGATVDAVDVRQAQVSYANLALSAVTQLPLQSVRSLFGHGHFGRRVWFYHFLRPFLDEDTRAFWDAHEDAVRGGLANQGQVERRVALMRGRALGLAVPREVVRAVASASSLSEQHAIFRTKWEGWRWRAALRMALSPVALAGAGLATPRLAGAASTYANQVAVRVQHAMATTWIAEHPNLRWALTGETDDPERGPAWLSLEGYAALRAARPRITVSHGRIADALSSPPPGGWNAFYLGDTLDELAPEAHPELLERLLAAAAPGARVASWRLARPYARPPALRARFVRDDVASAAALDAEPVPAWTGIDVETLR